MSGIAPPRAQVPGGPAQLEVYAERSPGHTNWNIPPIKSTSGSIPPSALVIILKLPKNTEEAFSAGRFHIGIEDPGGSDLDYEDFRYQGPIYSDPDWYFSWNPYGSLTGRNGPRNCTVTVDYAGSRRVNGQEVVTSYRVSHQATFDLHNLEITEVSPAAPAVIMWDPDSRPSVPLSMTVTALF